jgi:hypothetical protein
MDYNYEYDDTVLKKKNIARVNYLFLIRKRVKAND